MGCISSPQPSYGTVIVLGVADLGWRRVFCGRETMGEILNVALHTQVLNILRGRRVEILSFTIKLYASVGAGELCLSCSLSKNRIE
ncbi:hypothetical protein TNCV_510621 [Trichonephila clavipes]|nr:hypothetical protein TNCV_510621 [Trichonephila clavipes]